MYILIIYLQDCGFKTMPQNSTCRLFVGKCQVDLLYRTVRFVIALDTQVKDLKRLVMSNFSTTSNTMSGKISDLYTSTNLNVWQENLHVSPLILGDGVVSVTSIYNIHHRLFFTTWLKGLISVYAIMVLHVQAFSTGRVLSADLPLLAYSVFFFDESPTKLLVPLTWLFSFLLKFVELQTIILKSSGMIVFELILNYFIFLQCCLSQRSHRFWFSGPGRQR